MTTAQRVPDASHANWRCFPAPYVTNEQRNRSRSRSRSRKGKHNWNLSHSYSSTPHQWQEDPPQRPATAAPAVPQDPVEPVPVVGPTRSRSRLQKRPSQHTFSHHTLKTSVSTTVMSHSASHSRGPSSDQDITALPRLPNQASPDRRSSLRRKPVPEAADRAQPKNEHPKGPRPNSATHGMLSIRSKPAPAENHAKTDSDSENSSSSSSSGNAQSPTNVLRTPRHRPLAANDPFPLNPAYHIPSSDFSSGGSTESGQPASFTTQRSEHVLLPAGFRPGRSERTYVEEVMMPAVTHEVIKHNKTEIIQEEITREIHVHHYYTYTQPIKTIEILPARHFIVDGKTGEKVEIAAPEGWTLPTNMQPYTPDISGLRPEYRHYLVDDEHPNGVPEPPPGPISKTSNPELRKKKSSASGSWTPFPKVR